MPLFEVRHQPRAARLIQRALSSARLPHAYIFHGPAGVGKEMLALRVARLLLCESPTKTETIAHAEYAKLDPSGLDACGTCSSCHLASVGNHPDLHLIYRQLNAHHPDPLIRKRKALDLGVDVVRHFVINAVGVAPTMGKAKVFVIREADRITPGAQNALLKTLEEPPATTFLILLADSLDRLLSTTRSRCQLAEFGPLPMAFVSQQLRERRADLSETDARLYAALSQGSLGRALKYAEDEVAALNHEMFDLLAKLNRRTATTAAKRVQELAKERSTAHRQRNPELSDTAAQRNALRVFFVLLSMWYGDMLRVLAGREDDLTNTAQAKQLTDASQRFTLDSAARAVSLIAQTERQLDMNVNVQLCIESLLFKLAALSEPIIAA